jgi:hypothetical protein
VGHQGALRPGLRHHPLVFVPRGGGTLRLPRPSSPARPCHRPRVCIEASGDGASSPPKRAAADRRGSGAPPAGFAPSLSTLGGREASRLCPSLCNAGGRPWKPGRSTAPRTAASGRHPVLKWASAASARGTLQRRRRTGSTSRFTPRGRIPGPAPRAGTEAPERLDLSGPIVPHYAAGGLETDDKRYPYVQHPPPLLWVAPPNRLPSRRDRFRVRIGLRSRSLIGGESSSDLRRSPQGPE